MQNALVAVEGRRVRARAGLRATRVRERRVRARHRDHRVGKRSDEARDDRDGGEALEPHHSDRTWSYLRIRSSLVTMTASRSRAVDDDDLIGRVAVEWPGRQQLSSRMGRVSSSSCSPGFVTARSIQSDDRSHQALSVSALFHLFRDLPGGNQRQGERPSRETALGSRPVPSRESLRSSVTHHTQAWVSRSVSIPGVAGRERIADFPGTLPASPRLAGWGGHGTSWAIGRPRFVIITADLVRATSSSVFRQRSLNLPAAMVFIRRI